MGARQGRRGHGRRALLCAQRAPHGQGPAVAHEAEVPVRFAVAAPCGRSPGAHDVCCVRQDGQASKGELSARDLKLELEAKERAAARKRCEAVPRAPAARGAHAARRRDGGEADEARALLMARRAVARPAPVLRGAICCPVRPSLVAPRALHADAEKRASRGA